MRIAFATDNNKEINMHFGQAAGFAVYEVSAAAWEFCETVVLEGTGENDDKIDERLNALRGCAIVYCTQVGGVAAARLVKNRIHPIKSESGYRIETVLNNLRERLSNNPPLWLKRQEAEDRRGNCGSDKGRRRVGGAFYYRHRTGQMSWLWTVL